MSHQLGRSPFSRLSIAVVLYLTTDVILANDPVRYNQDIRPILAEHCFACHGLDSVSRKAELRLDLRDQAIESGAIVPGDSEASELIARVFATDEESLMPPAATKKRLTDEQRELLKRWVDQEAPYEKHWSLLPPVKPTPPAVDAATWPKNDVDRFVLDRLQQAGLEPAAELEPNLFFRRLHLDITGLPPTAADVDKFVTDYTNQGDDALSMWIDRLMESNAWGEHRARYWLDAARYADTHGMHFDNYREMWPYRDWVIRSFNRNQPFDQFTIEQLAGDLLDDPSTEQLIATGFQRCNMTTNEGGTIEAENLAFYAADRVQTFGWVYLGLTTNCCQCHDHKFDPLTTKDYYSLAAYFRNTTQPGLDGNVKDGRGPVVIVPSEADKDRWNDLSHEFASASRAVDLRRQSAQPSFETWQTSTDPDSVRNSTPVDGRLIRVPLMEESQDTIGFVAADEASQVTSTADPVWSNNGKLGPALRLKKGRTLHLGGLGDFAKDQPFSQAIWLRTWELAQVSSIVARMDEANQHRGWDLFFDNGRLAVHLIQSWPDNAIKVTTAKPVINKDQWHHVSVTWNGSGNADGITIYVDGLPVPTETNTNTLQPEADIRTKTPLRIGQRSQSAPFAGMVQDFQLYERELDADEIEQIRQAEWIAQILQTAPDDRSDEQRESLFEYYLRQHDPEFSQLTAELARLKTERAEIESRSPITHIQKERVDRPAMANILMRGQYDQIGDEVEAAPPAALHRAADDLPKNRLGLAKWVVDSNNPLTARVTVNRFWQELFGQGIVVTAEDFGVMGAPPTHPELLDWLATEFVDSGWDVKRLFKLMMTSATYRQAAITTPEKLEKDRDNSLLSRGPRFRMDAEMVRDFALEVSGLRSKTSFGPSVKPYQPKDLWNVVGLPGGDTREYQQDSGENLYRRSVYSFWKRMSPPPNLEAFNAPNREVCTVRRERTNTPMQALVTLNDPQFVEAARKLAERSVGEGGEVRSILDAIGRQVLSRTFTEPETKQLLATYADLESHYSANPEHATALLSVGESKVDESIPPTELAVWTMMCNQILNLDETLNK